MTKIVYLIRDNLPQEPVYEIARQEGVDVTVALVSYDIEKEQLQRQISQWEDEGCEILLCRGAMKQIVEPLVKRAFVIGMQFSAESTIDILLHYQKQHPGFFEEGEKKVLLLSTNRLSNDENLLNELFHVSITNVPREERQTRPDFVEFAKTFDLVICGKPIQRELEPYGVNAFYYRQLLMQPADYPALQSRTEVRYISVTIPNRQSLLSMIL